MTRKKDYWETIARHIARVVDDRKIEDVLHFTRLENLANILEHGIQSRSELRNADYDAYASDVDRLDEEDNAVSVSITCFYPKMFNAKRFRAGDKHWIILVLDRSLLWECHCCFYCSGVATNATKYQRGKPHGGFALEKLFADHRPSTSPEGMTFREECGLPSDWPTYPDSEVQVMDAIHPDYIRGAWVETPAHAEFVRATFETAGRSECQVVVQPFTARISHGPYNWG